MELSFWIMLVSRPARLKIYGHPPEEWGFPHKASIVTYKISHLAEPHLNTTSSKAQVLHCHLHWNWFKEKERERPASMLFSLTIKTSSVEKGKKEGKK